MAGEYSAADSARVVCAGVQPCAPDPAASLLEQGNPWKRPTDSYPAGFSEPD